MALKKNIPMEKNIPNQNWYKAYKEATASENKPKVPEAYMKVRYKTPAAPKGQVIDPLTKDKKKDRRNIQNQKHDWKRGHFED